MVMEWHCARYLYTKELTNFTGGIKYPPTFLKPMKRNGFTLIEMLITLTVLCIIVMIALPMHAMRAKRPRQAEAKAQLMVIITQRKNNRPGNRKDGIIPNFPKNEMYGLTSQIRRAVISIPANSEFFLKNVIEIIYKQ
jgi:prepilin-type N-terminal cleavage/methylation domain-containing protein